MRTIASLWIGDHLGVIEQASIQSFLAMGHQFVLYSYQKIDNVPDHVDVLDANIILSGDPIVRHRKTHSPAIHADLFRYALMTQTDYIWVDLDMIAVKPFDFDGSWVVGRETEDSIGGQVLRLPKESKTLQALLELTPQLRAIPPILKGFRRFKYQIKSLYYGGLGVDRWPYASTGPGLITYYMSLFDEAQHALSPEAFCYIGLHELERVIQEPELTLNSLPDDVHGIHLWAKELKKYIAHQLDGNIPPQSLLGNILSTYTASRLNKIDL